MASGWHKEPRRHSLAARGVKTTMNKQEAILKAPLEDKSTKLAIQFAITVPSTNYDKKIDAEEMRKRVKETAKQLSNRFGGDTAIKATGDYTSDGKLIREDVVIIESSMTKEDYKKNKSALEKYIKEKKKEWKQESIGYRFEDDFYIYPAFN
jgi:hypothetical protein